MEPIFSYIFVKLLSLVNSLHFFDHLLHFECLNRHVPQLLLELTLLLFIHASHVRPLCQCFNDIVKVDIQVVFICWQTQLTEELSLPSLIDNRHVIKPKWFIKLSQKVFEL